MKSLLKIALLLLLPFFVFAQSKQNQSGSLQLALKNASNDTIRMDIYKRLGDYYSEINRDSSVLYFEKALSYARSLKLKLNEASILTRMGYELRLQNYPRSLESLLQALNIANDPSSEKNVWHLPAGKTAENVRLNLLGYIYLNLARLYGVTSQWTGNINKQLENLRKAKKIASAIQDSNLEANTDLDLRIPFNTLGEFDSALATEQRALELYIKLKDKSAEGMTLKFMGDTYQKKGDLELARNVLLKAESILIAENDISGLGWLYNTLSNVYNDKKETDSAIFYAKKAKINLEINHQPNGVKEAYNILIAAFDQKNNKDSTLKYFKLSKILSDSLNDVERNNLLAFQDVAANELVRSKNLEKEKIETQNKIRIYALLSGILVFVLITGLLYKSNQHRKKTNELLQNQKDKIEEQKNHVEKTLAELKSTQAQLIQSEKMASLGELTAGIAHEIQNPLNFVNNFSEVNKEMITELKEEIEKGNYDEVKIIANDIESNEEKINHHGKRADGIVKGMLQHSRSSSGTKEPTDINALCDEYLRLSYHGLRAKDKSFNAKFETHFDDSIPKLNVVPQDIGRVVLNLINNAFYAVDEKKKSGVENYEPTVSVSTKKEDNNILISIKDNGNGIPESIKEKIFQPFFTTKPTGSGTGLGLSLSYDIIKAHGGEIKVETKENVGTTFTILLPQK